MLKFRLIITVDGDPGPSANFEFKMKEHFKNISTDTVAEIRSACAYMLGRKEVGICEVVAVEIRRNSIQYHIEMV